MGLTWAFSTDYTGFKSILATVPSNAVTDIAIVTKYDGKILSRYIYGQTPATSDQQAIGATNQLYLTVADTDTGFGETYTPLSSEVAAYMLGYKLNNGTFGTPYNGTGTKTWTLWNGISNTSSVTTVPTTPASGFTPYKLTYQLATPTVEEIAVEGSISLNEGGNQFEVGNGMVVREKASPVLGSSEGTGYYINTVNNGALYYRVNRLIAVYKNGKIDANWKVLTNLTYTYGNVRFFCPTANYDPTATYEVTYLALDQYTLSSSVQTINGEYDPNIKMITDRLVQNSADAHTRLFTVENLAKKIYTAPQQTVANMTLYVDATNGSDSNDGSAGKPFKTITKAISTVPQIVNHNYVINVADGTYNEAVTISGFTGGGKVDVIGNVTTPTNCNIKSAYALTCYTRIFIQGFNATDGTVDSFSINKCIGTNIQNCTSSVSAAGFNGFLANWSIGAVINCTFSNKIAAISSVNSSVIQSGGVNGTGNTYGLRAYGGGIIAKIDSVQPSGTTANELATTGGIISPVSGVTNPWGDNTLANRSRIYTTSNTTQSISAATTTKVALQVTNIDNLSEYNNTTYRYTAKNAETIDIKGALVFSSGMSTTVTYTIAVYKNGSLYRNIRSDNGTSLATPIVPYMVTMDLLAGDYLEIYLTTSTATVLAANSFLDIVRVA